MNTSLSENELSQLSEFVTANIGLYFPAEKWDELERNTRKAAEEFGYEDLRAYMKSLISGPSSREQLEVLASHLTVSETYFWREPEVFEALEEKILPELIRSQEKRERRLRIWSAGCATGEEPYSLAIALRKIVPELADWNIMILATDINPQILRKAALGVFGEWSFRNSPQWLKERYFRPQGNGKFEISLEIRNMVTFAYLNLAEDNYPSIVNKTNAMDIIFCRNVLMYFSPSRTENVVERLFHSLVSDGWLMVGASELSLSTFSKFASVHFSGAIVYRKSDRDNACEKVFQPTEFSFQSPGIQNEAEALSLQCGPNNEEKQIFSPMPSEILPVVPIPLEEPTKEVVAEGISGLSQTCAESVMSLANQGKLTEALTTCEKALLADKLDPQLYFLQATVLQEQNRVMEAIVSLKRALYIDPNFIMGHFVLGNLLLKLGKKQNAKKHFENVIVLLAGFRQNEILLESEGLTAGRLLEIVYATMQMEEIA